MNFPGGNTSKNARVCFSVRLLGQWHGLAVIASSRFKSPDWRFCSNLL